MKMIANKQESGGENRPENHDTHSIRVREGTIHVAQSVRVALNCPMIDVFADAMVCYHDFCRYRGFDWPRIWEDLYGNTRPFEIATGPTGTPTRASDVQIGQVYYHTMPDGQVTTVRIYGEGSRGGWCAINVSASPYEQIWIADAATLSISDPMTEEATSGDNRETEGGETKPHRVKRRGRNHGAGPVA